ncbi:MAG: sulfotransferase, partial [Tsuneonella troitsensis]
RDLDAILTEWRRKLTLRERRTAEGLHAHDGPVATIQYAAINADWRAAIASAYSDLGIELNGQAIAAMEREQAAAEKSPHHHHAGTLHQFARART